MFALRALTCAILIFSGIVGAQDAPQNEWPSFRGPESTGALDGPLLDGASSAIESVWRADIPGRGHSSPIVAGASVFVTTSYTNATAQLVSNAAYWLSALAAALLFVACFARAASRQFTDVQAFGLALRLTVLFVLVTFGRDLLACRNAPFRTWILCTLVAYVALEAARVAAARRRRGLGAVIVFGLVASAIAAIALGRMPTLRMPWILYSVGALPLLPVLLAIVRLSLFERARLATGAEWLLQVAVLAWPASYLWRVGASSNESVFWKIQPVHELSFPPWFYVGLAVVVVTCTLAFLYRARLRPLPVIAAGIVAPLVALAAVAPVINAFHYLRYHLVRGGLGSTIGLAGVAALTGLTSIACFAAWRSEKPRLPAWVLAVIAAAAFWLGSLAARSGGQVFSMLALDRLDGSMQWSTEGLTGAMDGGSNPFNTGATPTPAIAGGIVCGYFGNAGAFACDAATGGLRWTYTELPYYSLYGAASSLAVSNAAVIVQADSEGRESYVTGLSLHNGRPLWKLTRPAQRTWRTPVVFEHGGQPIVCAWAEGLCDLIDAGDGSLVKRLHGIECGDGDPITSPVIASGNLWLSGSETLVSLPLAEVFRADGVESSCSSTMHEPIDLEFAGTTCSTPAILRDWIVLVSDSGTVSCLSVSKRRVVWRAEVGDTLGSPVIDGSHAWVVTASGTIHAFRLAAAESQEVCTFELGGEVSASPVLCDGHLYVRTHGELICLRAKLRPSNPGARGDDGDR